MAKVITMVMMMTMIGLGKMLKLGMKRVKELRNIMH